MSIAHSPFARLRLAGTSLACALLALSGCASYDVNQGLAQVNVSTEPFSGAQVQLSQTAQDQARLQALSAQLLARPVDAPAAVQLFMTNSSAFQALLAEQWAQATQAAQHGRISNPMFSFERMAAGPETELTRLLSFGLLDVLTLPARHAIAQQRLQRQHLQLTADVVDQVTRVRQAWVEAVAAKESLAYAQKVHDLAWAGAELAKKMQDAGNFNRITQARHQAQYADAAIALTLARQNAQSRQLALVRQLGLTPEQARQLTLPDHLPALPPQALPPETVASGLGEQRLDVQMARAQWQAAAKAQGLGNITSLTDVEMTVRRTTVDDGAGSLTRSKGYEIGVRLPVFDSGNLVRQSLSAESLAAYHQLESVLRAASTHVQQSYGAYRAAYDVAQHYRKEVLPVQKTINEENILRYNAMLIGVFDVLADARQQMTAVMAAIDAQRQFWLADAALHASLMGRPMDTTLTAKASAGNASAGGH